MPRRLAVCLVALLTVGCAAEPVTRVAPVAPPSDPQPAAQQVEAQPALEIATLLLCKSVQQFGVYEPLDGSSLPAAQVSRVIVYCELENFQSQQAPPTPTPAPAQWETKLTYQASLYREGEDSVASVTTKPTAIIDHCRSRRRDFFLANRMTIPANLPAGRYLLKVTVVDQLANQTARKSVPIVLVAAAE